MMTTRLTPRLVLMALAVAFLTVGLTACGTAGTGEDIEPSLMAQVEGTPITEDNLGDDWQFVEETGDSTAGAFVEGPGAPPVGPGSAQFSLNDSADGLALFGDVLDGATRLDAITELTYSTYHQQDAVQAVTIQFDVNFNGNEEWGGRLVFEPNVDGSAVTSGDWQTWDALAQGQWWATGGPAATDCNQTTSCTLDEILTDWPNTLIAAPEWDPGWIIFKAGSGWTGGFLGNVDGFTLGVDGESATYNFGTKALLDKSDCKDGGWESLKDDDGNSFVNQGDCVSYFASNGKTRGPKN